MDVRNAKEVKNHGGLDSPADEWEDWMVWDPSEEPSFKEERSIISPANTESPSPPTQSNTSAKHTPAPSQASTGPAYSPPKRRLSSESCETTVAKRSHDEARISVQNRSHSIIEKRYRTNLNQKIDDLGKCIPALRAETQRHSGGESSTAAQKHNKATVLTKAMDYIRYLERRNAFLEDANSALITHAGAKHGENNEHDVESEQEASEPTHDNIERATPATSENTDSRREPQGLIPVPEEIRRLRAGQSQQHYGPQASSHSYVIEDTSSDRFVVKGGKIVGKLMVGSLAGLMVMDGIAGNHKTVNPKEKRDERGLLAIPLSFPSPLAAMISALQRHSSYFPHIQLFSPLLSGFMVFSILGIILFFYLYYSRPPCRKEKAISGPQPAPSLASPLEVRQRAWLTSIQTVWVPQHSMLPEMLALILETNAYFTRQFLGWRSYSWLTGRSEDEEIARVRAWDIAIDAQLSGGDPEISKSRLVLTLWAAGTLPNSPSRLMLKALHLRVLFWQPSRIDLVCRILHSAAARLANLQWKKAQRMQLDVKSTTESDDNERLPEHLEELLQQSSEETITDVVVQRAYNLVWNQPTSNGSQDTDFGITDVAEDSAMRGPLDALASWSSSRRLQGALLSSIVGEEKGQEIHKELTGALRTAPRGSTGKAQALAALAVFIESDRKRAIGNLVRAIMPPPVPDDVPLGLTPSVKASIKASFPVTEGLNIAVALSCSSLLYRIGCSNHESAAVHNAVQALKRIYHSVTDKDVLGFAAACHVLDVLLDDIHEGQSLHDLQKLVLTLVSAMDKAAVRKANCLSSQTSHAVCAALHSRLKLCSAPRRGSNASHDTGYGSMSDEE